MPPKSRKVVFARINRRYPGQDTLAQRTFAEDMTQFASQFRARFEEPATAIAVAKSWFAADMTVRAGGDYLTGALGFSEEAERRRFNNQAWSWVLGDTEVSDTASEDTVVPFAVDLRESHRWVAFATTSRLQPAGFTRALQEILGMAVAEHALLPAEWDVDLVTSRASIQAWLANHPLVHKMRRTVRFSNPGLDLDDDREEMRALKARRKTEEFAAERGGVLDVQSPRFQSKLDGTETGDLELHLFARGSQGATDSEFKSKEKADQVQIDDFGRDLQAGMGVVLAALQEYVSTTSGRTGYVWGGEG